MKFEAADHDMQIKTKLTPSFMFNIDSPDNNSNKLGNLQKGNVTTILKESAIDLSSSF